MKFIVLLSVVFAASGVFAQQVCDTSKFPLSSPTSKFEDHGDGTVTDRDSKLMWMRCSIGQTWAGGSCTGQAIASSFAAGQAAADDVNRAGAFFYNDWRLPHVRELAMIAERECQNPRVNLTVFPQTPSEFYWSTTSRPGNETKDFVFALSFGNENVKLRAKDQLSHVRLVRSSL